MEWKKVTTRHEAIVWAEEHGANKTKKGEKMVEISVPGKGAVTTFDDSRTMDKGERETFRFWYWMLGLFGSALLIFLGYQVYKIIEALSQVAV